MNCFGSNNSQIENIDLVNYEFEFENTVFNVYCLPFFWRYCQKECNEEGLWFLVLMRIIKKKNNGFLLKSIIKEVPHKMMPDCFLSPSKHASFKGYSFDHDEIVEKLMKKKTLIWIVKTMICPESEYSINLPNNIRSQAIKAIENNCSKVTIVEQLEKCMKSILFTIGTDVFYRFIRSDLFRCCVNLCGTLSHFQPLIVKKYMITIEDLERPFLQHLDLDIMKQMLKDGFHWQILYMNKREQEFFQFMDTNMFDQKIVDKYGFMHVYKASSIININTDLFVSYLNTPDKYKELSQVDSVEFIETIAKTDQSFLSVILLQKKQLLPWSSRFFMQTFALLHEKGTHSYYLLFKHCKHNSTPKETPFFEQGVTFGIMRFMAINEEFCSYTSVFSVNINGIMSSNSPIPGFIEKKALVFHIGRSLSTIKKLALETSNLKMPRSSPLLQIIDI